MNPKLKSLVDDVRAIVAEAESRVLNPGLTDAERKTVNAKLAEAENIKLADTIRSFGSGGTGPDLLAQWKTAGFEPGVRKASIPFWGAKTAIFADSIDDLDPIRRTGVALGFDQRYVYPIFPVVPVDSQTTSVQVLRQLSRTLAASDQMVRAVDSDSTKPETQTQAELVELPLKQVATVSSSIPNILVQNPAFASFIQNDLRLAYERALDWHVTRAIDDANPVLATGTFVGAVLDAADAIAAAGYNPTTVAVRPAQWTAYREERSDQAYVNVPNPLAGFRFVVAPSLYTDALVLDPAAAGKLYVSPVSLATFEENAGQTNSSTVRIESTAAFNVERVAAIVEVDVTA